MVEAEERKVNMHLWGQILAFIATRLVFNTAHRMVYPFLRVFAAGLGVDLTSMALAMSVRSASGMFGPFLATIADSRGRKTGMLVGSSLFILGMLLPLFWPTFPAFVLLLILATVGYLVFIPSMQAYLGDRVHYRQRGLAMGLTEMSWSLSFMIGIPVIQLLISQFGWQGPLPLLAFLGMAGWVTISRMIPADKTRTHKEVGWWKNFRQVLGSPMAWMGLGMGLIFSFSNELVNLIFGVWLEDSHRFSLGLLAQVAMGIGGVELVGELLSTLLADRMGKVLATAIGLLLGFFAALGLATLAFTPFTAVICLLLFYLAFEFSIVSSLPLMSEVLPGARATMMAANIALISFGRAIGAAFAPGLYGWGKELFPGWGLTTLGANAIAAAGLNLVAFVLVLRLRGIEKVAL